MVHLPPLLTRSRCATALVAVVACLSPGRASAECGDYVIILPPSGTPHPAKPEPTTAPQPIPVTPPCHGPNCSGSPTRETPPASPPATGGLMKESARHSAGTDFVPSVSGSPFPRDDTSPRPVRRASSIFHPPRGD